MTRASPGTRLRVRKRDGTTMRPILLISLLAITVVGCARAQGTGKSETNAEIEEEVLKGRTRKRPGYAKRRRIHLDRIYGDKRIFVNPRGQVLSKAQRLADVRPGNLDYCELCRRHGITRGSLYRWKAKYGRLEVR
jgi:hypothetical protein